MTIPHLKGPKSARGYRLCNPGNIDRKPGVRWQGEAADQSADPRFVVFADHISGIRAICRVLITYQDKHNIHTVQNVIDRWAPSIENNTKKYVEHVSDLMGVLADETIDVYHYDVMEKLVKAIITHELGGMPYDDATITAGLVAAGIEPPQEAVAPAKTTVATGQVSVGIATISGAVVAAVATIPAAKQGYDQVTAALGPVAEVVPWLPPLFGAVAFAALLYVGAHNLFLARVAGKRRDEAQ